MRATISDSGTRFMLEQQLRSAGVQWMDLNPYRDFHIQCCQIAVFSALISDGNNRVLDSWVITTIDTANIYNRDNYPMVEDAVLHHIGKMAQEGKILLVEPPIQYEESDAAEDEPGPGEVPD